MIFFKNQEIIYSRENPETEFLESDNFYFKHVKSQGLSNAFVGCSNDLHGRWNWSSEISPGLRSRLFLPLLLSLEY